MPKYLDLSPNYVLYRTVSVVDTTFDNYDHGVNTSYYEKLNVQVVPSGGANPTVEIKFWSDQANKFVSCNPQLSKSGLGTNVQYEFTVDCLSRTAFISVNMISAGTVEIYVSGIAIAHPE